jgi:hypothetical protein
MNDEIDAARTKIGRCGGNLGEALLKFGGPPVVDAAGDTGQTHAIRCELIELVGDDLDHGRRDVADTLAPTEHAFSACFRTRQPGILTRSLATPHGRNTGTMASKSVADFGRLAAEMPQ